MAGSTTPAAPETPRASVRQRVLEAVHTDPGISKSELCRLLGIAWGSACHHVASLTRQGQLKVLEAGRHKRLFPRPLEPRAAAVCAATRAPEAQQVLQALRQVRQSGLLELAGAASLSRKVVRRHLEGLVAAGLVVNLSTGRPRYVLAERVPLLASPSQGVVHPLLQPVRPFYPGLRMPG